MTTYNHWVGLLVRLALASWLFALIAFTLMAFTPMFKPVPGKYCGREHVYRRCPWITEKEWTSGRPQLSQR